MMYKLPGEAQLVIEDRQNYLYAEVSGPHDSFEISMAYWAVVAEQCHLRKTKRLLVFERLGQYRGERNMTLLIDSIIALGFEHIRVAYVDAFVEDFRRRRNPCYGARYCWPGFWQCAGSGTLAVAWLSSFLNA
jgi:hypothetical protein